MRDIYVTYTLLRDPCWEKTTVFRVYKVQHIPACSTTETNKSKNGIVEATISYISSENQSTDRTKHVHEMLSCAYEIAMTRLFM